MSLYILPNEILLKIFDSCDTCDLIRLNGVCKRFNSITSDLLKERAKHLLITSQTSEKFRARCQPILSLDKSKLFVHYMWKCGRYERKIFCPKFQSTLEKYSHNNFEFSDKFFEKTNIQMTKNTIWLNCSFGLYAFDRTRDGSLSDNNWISQKYDWENQICNMILCNDVIITSHRDDSIKQWTIKSFDKKMYFDQKLLHFPQYNNRREYHPFDRINLMDVTSRNIITGAFRHGTIKLWKRNPQRTAIVVKNISPPDQLWWLHSLVFDPTGTKFAAGYMTDRYKNADYDCCIIYDINKCSTETFKGIDNICTRDNYFRQLLWDDSNTLFCLGTRLITKMDVRTNKIVHRWSPPHDIEKVYFTCMSSDSQYAFITGRTNGQAVLWDQRQNAFIQTYEIPHNDPVRKLDDWDKYIHSVEFDSSDMYVGATKIYEFDFTRYPGCTRTRSILVSY